MPAKPICHQDAYSRPKWADGAILHTQTAPASTSWWTHAPRDGFTRQAQTEAGRMAGGKFGAVARPVVP